MRNVLDMTEEEQQKQNAESANEEIKEVFDSNIEKTPGVYTRAEGEKSPQEIDLLWSDTQTSHREEGSPVIFFVAGVILSTLILGAIWFLFNQKPDIKQGDLEAIDQTIEETQIVPGLPETVQQAAVTSDNPAPAEATVETSQEVTSEKATPTKTVDVKPISTAKPVEKPKATEDATEAQMTTYVVKNGDTLEKVAKKHYGSMDPKYIEKIQRASNMKNPHQLSIGQKLVIPPKDY